ncbi:uncharacterized protein LOC134235439 [Saccostrea cucullata]|uniref:uncharacterized protein LOC134235439 n=1 Tax=Saccostrea cuccullata TaxID=36930 RepID=UPI002ED3F4BA
MSLGSNKMSEQAPAPGSSDQLGPSVQPIVAKDLDGNYVYYLPEKPVTEAAKCGDDSTVKTPVSASSTQLSTTEQVITLSPAKSGNSNIVTINSENIIGRFDPETLNSLNKLLEEVDPETELNLSSSKESVNTKSDLTVKSSSCISNPVSLAVSVGTQGNGQIFQVTAEIHSSGQLQPPPAGLQSNGQINPVPAGIQSNGQLQSTPTGILSNGHLSQHTAGIHSTGGLQPPPAELCSSSQLLPPCPPAGVQSNGQLSQVPARVLTSGQSSSALEGLQSSGQLNPVPTGIQDNGQLFPVASEMQSSGQLSQITTGIQSNRQLQPAPPEVQATGPLPPASTLLSSLKPINSDNSVFNSTIDNNVADQNTNCRLQTENSVSGLHANSVSFGNPVTIPLESNIPVSQKFPALETTPLKFTNQTNVGKELHLQTQTINPNLVPPAVNQNINTQNQTNVSLQAMETVLSMPLGILNSIPMSQNMNQLIVQEQRNNATEHPVKTLQTLTTHSQCLPQVNAQSIYQKNVIPQSVYQPVLQNTSLPGFQSLQCNLALSTYQPVQVFSTPSSQYQQSRMSTPKYIPQLDTNMTTSTSYPYNNQSRSNLDLQPTASGSQLTIVQDGRSCSQPILTDLNMNTIQHQNSDISGMLSCIDQISAKNPLPAFLEQTKCLSPNVQNYSRNGYTHHLGLPVQSVSNQGSLYNMNAAHLQTSSLRQHYPTNLPQPQGTSVLPSLAPSVASMPMVNNFSIQSNKSLTNDVTHPSSNYLSSATTSSGYQSPGLQRHNPQSCLQRPQSNTPSYFSGSDVGYLQNAEPQITIQKSQQSRSNHPLKLMPKTQMLAVKKAISMYWPDFSNYPEVCTCEKFDMGNEIHVEQIWLHMNQMYYLPQIQILAIGTDEFVGIVRDEKYYVSVGEIIMRLLPKLQREVESYIPQSKCEVELMTLEELAYLKQRGCTKFDIFEMISLETLREMCRFLLNKSSKLSSELSKLAEAATGIYYKKVLEKHTRCSKCGGAIKCSDILDRYEAIDCPVGISSKEQRLALLQRTYSDKKFALRQKEVIESAFSKKKSSPQSSTKTGKKNISIKVGRLLVGGTQFNTFKINDKCYISLKELVAFKISTLQVLQNRLANLEYRPRPAPSCVERHFIQNNIGVHNTLWLDTVIVRCMCCLGQQKTQMPLQKHFKCGDFEDLWEKELEGTDDCDVNGTVFTLNPSTITISNRRLSQRNNSAEPLKTVKKNSVGPSMSTEGETLITMCSCKNLAKKPLTIQMRNLTSHLKTSTGSVLFTTKPGYREYTNSPKPRRNRVSISPWKTQKVLKDVNLDSTSLDRSLDSQPMALGSLNTGIEQDAQADMTEESILEIAAREAMLMPEDLNEDSDGIEYPRSVDSVIQAIGMGDELPSEDFVMQEIEKGGLNLFDGVLSASICGDSKNQFEDSDKVTVKTPQKVASPRKSEPPNQRNPSKSSNEETSVMPRRTESRTKKVPKRFEEFLVETDKKVLQSKKDSKKEDGLCTTIKHDDIGAKKKLKNVKKVQILRAPEFREKIKNGELDGRLLQVIRHSDLDGITEMVPRNPEEAASVSPIADTETNQAEVSEKVEECEKSQSSVSSATSCDNTTSGIVTPSAGESVCVSEPSELINSKEQEEKSSEVINENNIEILCSPIKNMDSASCSASPNTSTSSLSEELRTSRIKRVYDKVAALESSQDEYRILHMLATVAEVVTESKDEQTKHDVTVSCDQQESENVISAKDTENSAKSDVSTNNVKSGGDSSDEVSTERQNLDTSETIHSVKHVTESALLNADKDISDRDIQSNDRSEITNQTSEVNGTELTNEKVALEPIEDESVVKDDVPVLYSPLLFDDEAFSDHDDETLMETQVKLSPKKDKESELQERLSKFVGAVNRYVDVTEFQREPGIATSRVRFIQGAEEAFPGLYGDDGLQRRKTFAVLLNRMLYHQDELTKQVQQDDESSFSKSLSSVGSAVKSGKSCSGIKSASKTSSQKSSKSSSRRRVPSRDSSFEKTPCAKKRKLC